MFSVCKRGVGEKTSSMLFADTLLERGAGVEESHRRDLQVSSMRGGVAFLFSGKKNSKMEPQQSQGEYKQSSAAPNPAITSCRRKKKDEATFLEDVKDHIDEFISASMDEHKSCFKKTIKKMFGMSKIVAERNANAQEVESVLPLQTTVSE